MRSGMARNFTYYREIYGSWVSIDKPDDDVREVRVYGSK